MAAVHWNVPTITAAPYFTQTIFEIAFGILSKFPFRIRIYPRIPLSPYILSRFWGPNPRLRSLIWSRKKLLTLLGSKSGRGGQKCCEADFGSRIKISGASIGAICIVFRATSFPTGPRVPGWGEGANISGGSMGEGHATETSGTVPHLCTSCTSLYLEPP